MMLFDARNGHACAIGRGGRTEVVGGHHDAVFVFDGEDASTSDDRLLGVLDAVCERIVGAMV